MFKDITLDVFLILKLTLRQCLMNSMLLHLLQVLHGKTDRDQIIEDFTNGGRGHSPKHLKFFLLVF